MADWSEKEVELIITDYFEMLSLELAGKTFLKSSHRRNLSPLLNNRSEGSIEFKHQNISAVLINLGQPYIIGYLPRYNYQKILEEKVIEYLQLNLQIENQFKSFAEKVVIYNVTNFNKILVDPPILENQLNSFSSNKKNPIKINYLEKEQSNSILGSSGEEFVLKYERWCLMQAGKEKLSNQIKWISKEEGDGAGFDILSKYPNGSDKYIEVKTTKLGKETPFYFTRNELQFSQNHYKDYNLYRVFNFSKEAKMFTKNGSLDKICHSVPISYQGYF
jgi:hypothetical protein